MYPTVSVSNPNPKHSLKTTWLFVFCFLAVVTVCFFPDLAITLAHAGEDGPLGDVYDDLVSWTQGNVGKTVALGMMLVGIVGGIARQSLMAFAVGIGGGLGLANTDTIISEIFSATL